MHASSLPVGDVDTALTSKSGQTTQVEQAQATDEADPGLVDEERTAEGDETDEADPGLVDEPDAAEDEEDTK